MFYVIKIVLITNGGELTLRYDCSKISKTVDSCKKGMKLFLLMSAVGGATAFSATTIQPKEITVKLGEPWSVLFKTSTWYEVDITDFTIFDSAITTIYQSCRAVP